MSISFLVYCQNEHRRHKGPVDGTFVLGTAVFPPLFAALPPGTGETHRGVLLSRASGARCWIKSILGPSSVDLLGSACSACMQT